MNVGSAGKGLASGSKRKALISVLSQFWDIDSACQRNGKRATAFKKTFAEDSLGEGESRKGDPAPLETGPGLSLVREAGLEPARP